MTFLTLTLVLAAAFRHAAWNYYAKRDGGGRPFGWAAVAMAAGVIALALG